MRLPRRHAADSPRALQLAPSGGLRGPEAAIALSNVIRPFSRPSVTQLNLLGGGFLFRKQPEGFFCHQAGMGRELEFIQQRSGH